VHMKVGVRHPTKKPRPAPGPAEGRRFRLAVVLGRARTTVRVSSTAAGAIEPLRIRRKVKDQNG